MLWFLRKAQAYRWYVEHFRRDQSAGDVSGPEHHIQGEGLCRMRYGEILMVCLLEKAQAYRWYVEHFFTQENPRLS